MTVLLGAVFLKNFLCSIKDDLKVHSNGNGFIALVVAFFLVRGFHLIFLYRVQRSLLRVPIVGKLSARLVWYVSSVFTGCEISYHSIIHPGVCFPHPVGIVIGESEICGGVTILQGVTIGKRGKGVDSCVKIGSGAFIGAGAKILGDIEIGANAAVGANAVVLVNVPAGALALGVPASIKLRVVENES
jgi:serine O-acetyltransferase